MANNNDDGNIRPEVAELIESMSSNNATARTLPGNVRFSLRYSAPLNEREMDAIAEAISNSTLVGLDLSSVIEGSSVPAASRFLGRIFETHPSLRKIDLSSNGINSQLAGVIGQALKTNTSLEVLWLYSNEIGARGAEALAEGLRENSTIQTIYLGNNSIGLRGAQALAEALRINKTLVTINLSDNRIGPRGGVALAEVFGPRRAEAQAEELHHNNTLRAIHIRNNDIGDETAVAIADALRYNSSLLTIGLSRNNRITNVGAMAIEDALSHLNYTVEDIQLDYTGVSQDLRRRISRLCECNVRVKAFLQQVNPNVPAIPLAVWPKVLEAVECKPDMLFALLKTKPEVVRERQHNRRRRRRDRIE